MARRPAPTSATPPTIDPRWFMRVRGLRKRFAPDGPDVVDGMDLDIERGAVNVIVGASGSGKSVLLKLMIGLYPPTEGQIWVDGVDVCQLRGEARIAFLRRAGFMFQSTALFDSLNVEDNVAFPMRELTSTPMPQIRKRALELLERLGVGAAVKKLPGELSGGMRKRVALARALMLDPELIIYDEPTTGLDPLTTESVDELLIEIKNMRPETTSIVISHDMSSVFRLANRLIMIHEGKIAAEGTPDEVRSHRDQYVRDFLALSLVEAAQPLPPRA